MVFSSTSWVTGLAQLRNGPSTNPGPKRACKLTRVHLQVRSRPHRFKVAPPGVMFSSKHTAACLIYRCGSCNIAEPTTHLQPRGPALQVLTTCQSGTQPPSNGTCWLKDGLLSWTHSACFFKRPVTGREDHMCCLELAVASSLTPLPSVQKALFDRL